MTSYATMPCHNTVLRDVLKSASVLSDHPTNHIDPYNNNRARASVRHEWQPDVWCTWPKNDTFNNTARASVFASLDHFVSFVLIGWLQELSTQSSQHRADSHYDQWGSISSRVKACGKFWNRITLEILKMPLPKNHRDSILEHAG